LTMVRPFGIRELVRTGPVAMTRGGGVVQLKDQARDQKRGEVSIAAD
jgi:hypothetical protein